MPPEGATQKSYKALQIMSLFRLKTVVKTPMIPYLVCRPKVIFFFFSPSPTAESALMKKPGWECLRVPWRLCTSSINFLTVIQHLYKCDGWLVLNVSCQSSTVKAECILAIGNQKKLQMPSAEKMLNPLSRH